MKGAVEPCGKYKSVSNRIVGLSQNSVAIPHGFCITQHDNNQIVPKSFDLKSYQKQQTSIINANAFILFDSDNLFQFKEDSYPGHRIYRDLTETEINNDLLGVVNGYKSIFRAERNNSMLTVIEHLKETSHENLVDVYNSTIEEMKDIKVCSRCSVFTKHTDIRRCVDCAGGTLVKLSEEQIFLEFQNRARIQGLNYDCRYEPSTGYRELRVSTTAKQRIIPADPDMLPPTTKTNLASIVNTAGHR